MTATPSFTRILLTTDLSPEAAAAYGYARSLAEHHGASLILLSCIDTSIQYAPGTVGALEVPSIYAPEDTAQQTASVTRALDQLMQTHFQGLSVSREARAAPTPVAKTIVNFSNERAIDLIVMASHGRSGIRRALLGSTAEHVLRHSSCPVLVVPIRE